MINQLVIIDDDPTINEMLKSMATEDLKLDAMSFTTGEDFFSTAEFPVSSIFIVDWNLPGIKGPDIIKGIRERDKISPIFMISGNHDKEYVLEGLRLGADDYLLKPFMPDELLAKIKNAIQKALAIDDNLMNVGLKLIPEGGLLIKDGTRISLTTREFQVFRTLYENPLAVRSRQDIMSMFNDETSERNIDVVVFSLRKKISAIGLGIETVRNQGYKLGNLAH